MLHKIDLSRVDLNLFVLFEAVLQERHVGRAAERLALSPSAVSHGLGRLRRLLDDPVFIRTPRGVSPTARALELAGPIEELLRQARGVIAVAAPFDPSASTRTFMLGAPDGIAGVFLPSLLSRLRVEAPKIDLRLRQVLPPSSGRWGPDAWEGIFGDLDARRLDIALGPFVSVPARFAARTLWVEDFVVASRPDHPFAQAPTLETYCAADHLVVSQTGDGFGFVDVALAERGLSRRVALTAPAFAMALSIAADSDLLAAVPRSVARGYADQAGVVLNETPLPLPSFEIRCVTPKAALADAGLAWFWDTLAASVA